MHHMAQLDSSIICTVAAQPCCLLIVIERLCFGDAFQPAVLWVLNEAAHLCSGLHETLYMTVAIPLLWGIPPRHETLR